ncbi:MAG: phosphoenolpyruvate--protein phosphotransferase, partial [Chloroflexota bacterium]
LLGVSDSSLNNLKVPSIIIAEDLSPSDTARLDPQFTLGFCTSSGGLTSHSAILARAMGIPAIVAMGENLQKYILTGTPLVLDGWQGNLIIDPGESTILNFYESKERHALRHAQISQDAQQPAQTADGYFVEVSANISNVESARQAIANGTEGIGLLRTEFLYLHDTRPPEEETQIKIYKEIFEIIGQKPIIIRTLDIGGDKPPSYLTFPIEMNPFLGWRAIRVSLDQPDLFKTQLRAILRAGFGYDVRIMFPMIIDLEEILRARQLFEQAQAELRNEKLDFKSNMQVGIMIETPAAAMIVDILADHVDFFSLGTNDLTQYTLAVDRGNAHIADRYQPLHPSVLRLIKQSIEMAHAKGKWVGMCGEMAGMLEAIPVLLGLGLDEVSVNPQTIPEVKYLIRQLTKDHTQRINEHVFGLNSVMEIKTYLNERLREFM